MRSSSTVAGSSRGSCDELPGERCREDRPAEGGRGARRPRNLGIVKTSDEFEAVVNLLALNLNVGSGTGTGYDEGPDKVHTLHCHSARHCLEKSLAPWTSKEVDEKCPVDPRGDADASRVLSDIRAVGRGAAGTARGQTSLESR